MPRKYENSAMYDFDDGVSLSLATASKMLQRKKKWVLNRIGDGDVGVTGSTGQTKWCMRVKKKDIEHILLKWPKCIQCKVPVSAIEVAKYSGYCGTCYRKLNLIPAAKLDVISNSVKYHLLWFFRIGGTRLELPGLSVVKMKSGKFRFTAKENEEFEFDPEDKGSFDGVAEWLSLVNIGGKNDEE